MREPTIARDRERGLPGVIDTLSAGYTTVNRHPWILVVPVLLDLFFWLGPRLSVVPLLERALGHTEAPTGLPADMLQTYQDTREAVLQAGESFSLFSLLANHFPGIPSLMAAREGMGPIVALADPWVALELALLLPIAGIWLASVYFVAVGQTVRGTPEGTGLPWARVWQTWWALLRFLLFLLVAGLLLGVPLGFVALLAGAASVSLLGFLGALIWVAALWIGFYLFFVVDAMVISDAGPIRAIRNSVVVVRYNIGSALGLVLLIWVITLGMPIVWDAVAQNPIGVVVALLGNAYIATGLAAASMTYYRDRFSVINR